MNLLEPLDRPGAQSGDRAAPIEPVRTLESVVQQVPNTQAARDGKLDPAIGRERVEANCAGYLLLDVISEPPDVPSGSKSLREKSIPASSSACLRGPSACA